METITAEVTGKHVLKTRCRQPRIARIARTSPIVVPAASAGSRWLLARHPCYGKASSLVGYSTPRPPPSFVGPPPRQCRPKGRSGSLPSQQMPAEWRGKEVRVHVGIV